MKFVLYIASLLIFLSCSSAKKAGYSKEIIELQNFMTGSFDSSAQALTDSSYLDITMHLYPIWKNKKGVWLYVEQAMSSKLQKPYRQRIYQLEEVRKRQFISRVYKLEQAERFIGKWNEPSFFKKFGQEILSEREGCEVYLNQITSNNYEGSTKNQKCTSSLGGAKYATSIVTIGPYTISSWDRGFDSKDKQVWGAVKGPYVFIRK